MILTANTTTTNAQFLTDTLSGLSAEPKFMSSKYFYDERGDHIFQQIMDMEEYYLTGAEMEIMKYQAGNLANVISADSTPFDLIELGAGDATKSVHLLKALIDKGVDFKYFPIDISENVIALLENSLPQQVPALDFEGLNGDYFEMLEDVTQKSQRKKVLLFMGANIGNMDIAGAQAFCRKLGHSLAPDDLLVIGFDLKKNPRQILAAYNDKQGITRKFNLNLLTRINRELNADFDLEHFDHYATYDPESGACKSYLVSLSNQAVNIGSSRISFAKHECIFMEISQKYSLIDIEQLAKDSGFKVQQYFTDQHHYFVDAVWKVD